MKLLIRAAINAVIIVFTFRIIDGLSLKEDWFAIIVIVALLAFANAFVSPILKFLALPIRVITLGVATLVINVLVVAGVIWLAGQLDIGVTSTGWGPTALGALMITVLTSVVSAVLGD